MAIYTKGPLGEFSGKMGSVIGSNWRSIKYMRSVPRPTNKPASTEQKSIRSSFALVSEFISPLRDFLNLRYSDSKGKKTGFDKAMSQVMTLVEGSYPDLSINYGKVEFSRGGLSPIRPLFLIDDNNNLKITWKPTTSLGTAESNDLVSIVLYDEKLKDYYVFENALERGAESFIINRAEIGSGDFHIWTMVTSFDLSRFSNSIYHGLFRL